uniref:Profilin n=1 Tax=Strombidium inclinatum TaxID=197538 RepID=A0A7S3IKQ9_9SPIT|mmetsp:Transcript_24870/g.38678  ORF Transcript_24870/g.38678 Transcript_24870/m.38678 type:complete len:168 (+) Transcript_24870:18-521(+)
MSWDQYVHKVQNTLDPATNNWSVTNVCSYACVYGHDGAQWAASQGFQLATYQFDMPQEDGSTKPVNCNEHSALMKAAGGDRKGGQECGIRICNQKYMFLKSAEEKGVKFCVLSRQGGGGACIGKTAKTLIVGVWDKTQQMSNGGLQNTGDCEKNVLNTAKELAAAGY